MYNPIAEKAKRILKKYEDLMDENSYSLVWNDKLHAVNNVRLIIYSNKAYPKKMLRELQDIKVDIQKL